MALIEIKNLALGYGKTAIFSGLSLKIEPGDFISVVGPNGIGKTTFIKGLLGLIKPKSGEIVYQDLKQAEIGFIPQETKIDPHFPASVFEIVLMGSLADRRFGPRYSKTAKAKADEKLKLLKIEKLKSKSFAELSGGEKQKVLLTRALMASSKLLVLDEPSNNLDPVSKRSLYDILLELNKSGLAIIMVTHDLDHDNLLGRKVLSLRNDEIFFGKTDEFIRKVHHE